MPVKGLDVLIQACSLLAEAGTQFTCYLIGEGPMRTTLERQIAHSGLAGQIRLVGTRPNGQLPDWFRAANLFVLPSRSEGLPTVLLEALASGTPFVATRVGGIPELATLGPCRLVRPEDPRQLAQAIRLSIDEDKASGEAVAAQPRLKNHDEEASELTSFLEIVRRGYHDARGSGASLPCPAPWSQQEVACNDQPNHAQ